MINRFHPFSSHFIVQKMHFSFQTLLLLKHTLLLLKHTRRFVPLKRRKKKLLRRFSKMKRRFIFRVSVLSEKEVAAYFIFLFSLFPIRLFAECQVQAHKYGNTAQISHIERKSS
mgnify:CR=1 FL=1